MSAFTVLLLSHEYGSTEIERQIVEQAGGRLVDADTLPEAGTNARGGAGGRHHRPLV